MKNIVLFLIVFAGSLQFSKAQEIVPFPDLSESHIVINNQSDIIDNYNYSLYTKDYQEALKKIDLDIEGFETRIELEADVNSKKALQNKKTALIKRRTALIQEAELLEDLNKFY